MPQFEWTCVKCKSGRKVTSDKAPYGTRAECKCGTVTVPLKCVKCNTGLSLGGNTESPGKASDFLGGRKIQCVCGHVFTVPVSEIELRERVTMLGGTEVGEGKGRFNQAERAEPLPTELKETVKGGYCEGMCLDWIRRVVQGGGPTYQVSPFDASKQPRTREQIVARETSQTQRGATAWVTRYKGPKDQFLQKSQSDYEAELKPVQEAKEEAKKNYDALFDAYEKKREQYNKCKFASEQTSLKPEIDEAKRSADEASAKNKALAAQVNKIINARNEEVKKTELERFWTSYAELMDEFVAKQRSLEKREASKRAFSSLTIAASVPSTEYASVPLGVYSLLSNPQFTATRAACLGFSKYTEKSGHAVAVHRLNTGDKYHLFDPNLGTFEFGDSGLQEALGVIFSSYYEGYTTVGGKAKSDYSIFFSQQGEKCPSSVQKVVSPEVPQSTAPVIAKPTPVSTSVPDQVLTSAATGNAGRVSPPRVNPPQVNPPQSSTTAPSTSSSPSVAELRKRFNK